MTREEKTGIRSLEFSKWIRRNIADSSTGQCVGNLDWIFWNYKTRKLIVAEEKCYKSEMSTWFKRFVNDVLDPALRLHCEINGIEYGGFFLIQFENTSPDDGKIFVNGKQVTVQELKRIIE